MSENELFLAIVAVLVLVLGGLFLYVLFGGGEK